MSKVPKSLKTWFFIHFIIDILFAIPLIFFPKYLLGLFGLQAEVITVRLVGAALVGIGGASFFTKTYEQFRIMLILKLFWSVTAILVLLIEILDGAPLIIISVLAIFLAFSIIWQYYYKKLK